jgi:hypothetical protein
MAAEADEEAEEDELAGEDLEDGAKSGGKRKRANAPAEPKKDKKNKKAKLSELAKKKVSMIQAKLGEGGLLMRRFVDSQGSKAKAGAEDEDEAADEEPVPPSKKKAAAKATAKKEKSGGDTPAAQAAEEGDASGG